MCSRRVSRTCPTCDSLCIAHVILIRQVIFVKMEGDCSDDLMNISDIIRNISYIRNISDNNRKLTYCNLYVLYVFHIFVYLLSFGCSDLVSLCSLKVSLIHRNKKMWCESQVTMCKKRTIIGQSQASIHGIFGHIEQKALKDPKLNR